MTANWKFSTTKRNQSEKCMRYRRSRETAHIVKRYRMTIICILNSFSFFNIICFNLLFFLYFFFQTNGHKLFRFLYLKEYHIVFVINNNIMYCNVQWPKHVLHIICSCTQCFAHIHLFHTTVHAFFSLYLIHWPIPHCIFSTSSIDHISISILHTGHAVMHDLLLSQPRNTSLIMRTNFEWLFAPICYVSIFFANNFRNTLALMAVVVVASSYFSFTS